MAQKTGTELNEIRNNIKIDVLSILFASKDGVTEKELTKEYFMIKGQSIPYTAMGFLNLFDFMKAPFMKNSVRIERRGPSWVYFGIHNEATESLGNMVKHQIDLQKSKREKNRMYEAFKNYQLNNNGINKNMDVPNGVQKIIEEILRKENNFEMTSENFKREYLLRTGLDFKSIEYGYQTSCELFESLSHLVQISNKFNDQFKIKLIVKPREKIENGQAITTSANEYVNKTEETFTAKQFENKLSNEEAQMTFEEEIIENLKEIIEIYCKDPTPLSSISSLYKQHTQKTLDISKLGFNDICKFLSEKLSKHFRVKPGENDHYIVSRSSKNQLETLSSSDSSIDDSDDDDSDIEKGTAKLEMLKNLVRKTLEGYTNKIVTVNMFLKLFEKRIGYPMNPHDFNQRTLDHLLKRLVRSKTIQNCITEKYEPAILLLPYHDYKHHTENSLKTNAQNGTTSNITKSVTHEQEMTKEQLIKYRADLKQEFVLADEDLDPKEIWRDFLKSQTINIIVSCVINPCEFYIQLVDNKQDLENLMNELELTYCGFGASYYDMPAEYITVGRYCAGLFPFDNNWHRCKILEVFPKKKEAKVSYIDYGGNDILKFANLKFLDKKYAQLPIQIVTAKLHNIKNPIKNIWPPNTQNYFLDLVRNKSLVATIMGINNTDCTALFSLDLTLITTSCGTSGMCPKGTTININKRVVQDGFGEFFDECTDIDYIEFNDFRRQQKNELDLEEIVENKNLISEILEKNKTQAVKTFLNNNIPDEESSPVFRKPLNDIKSRKQYYPKASNAKVLLFRINKVVYAHWKQVSDLLKIEHEDFLDCLNSLDRDEFIKKLKCSSQCKGLFDSLYEEMGIKERVVHLFEFQKLGKLIESLYSGRLAEIMKKKLDI